MSAPEPSDIIESFQWFVIPHGRVPGVNGKPAKQRLTLRVMPRLYKSSFTSSAPTRLDTLDAARDPIGTAAVLNWPKFLAEIESIGINYAPQGSARINAAPLFEVKIGAERAAQLAARGATTDLASRIWTALFPRTLAVKPVDDTNPDPRAAGANPQVRKRHPPLPQAFGAARLHEAVGNLHGNGLAALLPGKEPRGSRAAGVLEVRVRSVMTGPVASLAAITRSLALPAKSIGALHAEFTEQLAPGPFPLASVMDVERIAATGFPFSDRGHEALKSRLMRWNDSRIKSPAITQVNYTLTDFVLDRLIALAPDLPRNSSDAAARADLEQPEFHRDIGKLAFHPWLMEVLGLSLHVEVDDFLPRRNDVLDREAVGLYVTEINHRGTPAPIVPRVQTRTMTLVKHNDPTHPSYDPDDGHSMQAPGDVKYRGGCVVVTAADPGDTPPFELEQLDVDSTVEKVLSVAQTLGCQFEAGVVADQREAALSTLRTGGLSLLARKLDQQDGDRSARTKALREGGNVAEFFADDLIVGYRPDLSEMIPDGRGGSRRCSWKSLVTRKLTSLRINGHEFAHSFSRVPTDETFIAPHARMLDGGDADQAGRLLFFEELFRWDGWSLGAPHIERTERTHHATARDLQATYGSGGGLPRQRFGWGYRLGMRAVFLDGWSVTLAEAAKLYDDLENNPMLSLGTDQVGNQIAPPPYSRDQYFTPFFRYEGVQPANIVEHRGFEKTSSERQDRLLVKSDGHGRILAGLSERVLIPPLIDVENAIRAGMFDTEQGHRVAPKSHQVPDPWATRLILGIYRRGDDQLQRFEYFDYYKSDVWPNHRSLKIRSVATTSELLPAEGFDTRWDGDTLIFRIAPGISLTLRCWHEITEKQLATSGVVEAMVRWLMTAEADSVRKALGLESCDSQCDLRDGLIEVLSQWHTRFPYDLRPYLAADRFARDINLTSFSMLNPALSLEIVHAVPIPARAPLFSQALSQLGKQRATRLPATASEIATRFEIVRESTGATVAEFKGDVEFHRASTERVDCFAEWDDITDEVGTRWLKSPKRHSMFRADNIPAVLESVPTLDRGMVPVGVEVGGHSVFGPESPPDLPPDNDLLMLDRIRPGIGRMRNQDFGTLVPHFDFADAKARLVTFRLRAASRYIHDFSKGTNPARDSETAESRWLKATLPPSKPQVSFVIPLFEHDSTVVGSMVRRRRHGGWFRIWLERPWYSSGAGELLALVCWPQELFRARGGSGGYLTDKARRAWGSLRSEAQFPPGKRPSSALERLYTGWGLDPIWDQPNARLTYIPPGAFSNRLQPDDPVRVAPSQLLAPGEGPSDDNSVALALYRPDYDPSERRWYVDVRINPPDDAYFPFVRLGLARYQPNAIPGCELSEIVTSEFVQLTPDRSVTVTVEPPAKDDWNKVRVEIAGPRALGLSDPDHPGVETKMVIRVDGAVGHSSHKGPLSWMPQRNSDGLEDVELTYDTGSRLWRGNHRYRLESSRAYSVWLEEREGILVDGSPTAAPGDAPVVAKRVTYADRIPLQT